MQILKEFLIALAIVTGLFWGLTAHAFNISDIFNWYGQERQALGAFSHTFLSLQLATDPDNGECLTTDGTDNVWSTCSSGSPFPWTVESWGNSTSTTLGFLDGFLSTASSTIDSNLTVTGNATTTGLLHLGEQEASQVTQGSINRVAIQPYSFVTSGPFYIGVRDGASTAYLDFKYGNSQVFTYDNNGNMGVGALGTTPTVSLDVRGGSGNLIGLGGAVNVGYFGMTSVFDPFMSAVSGRGIHFRVNGASTDSVTITSAGNLGVGTSTPTTNLQVTTTASNATSTLTVGKLNQTKGSCLELFDAVGTAYYLSVVGGALQVTTDSCK